jgi:phosphoribosylanthranilate isomerase
MWIKLCGIRDVETARAAAEAGADAIGLNFYARSPRRVSVQTARQIVAALPDEVTAVGLFVDHPPGEVLETVLECGLQAIQLHGDELPPEILAIRKVHSRLAIVRALRFDGDSTSLTRPIRDLRRAGVELAAVLVDAKVEGAYGGTGHTLPWERLADCWDRDALPPLVLAGGLTPENVAEAMRVVQPWGVDTASGIETSPGVKDAALMRAFVAAARAGDSV